MKALKTVIYILACFVLAGTLVVRFTMPQLFYRVDDILEVSGIVTAILMGFEMLLLAGIMMVKYRILPQAVSKHGVKLTALIMQLHKPVGALALAFMGSHFIMVCTPVIIWEIDYITGMLCAVAILLSCIIGVAQGESKNKKVKRKLHIAFAFIAAVPFLFHIFV